MKNSFLWKLMDNLKRKNFIKYELKKKLIGFKKSKKINKIYLEYINFKESSISSKYSFTKINNRCIISGRNYNVYNKFQYSRFKLRKEGYLGNIASMQKF